MRIIMITMAIVLLITSFAFADIRDTISDIIDKHPVKVAEVYNFDRKEWDAMYGVTTLETNFIDLAIYHDGDEYLSLGIDLNVPFTKNSKIGIVYIFGFDRMNKLRGEAQSCLGLVGKVRF